MRQGSGLGFSAHRIVHGVGHQDVEESLLPERKRRRGRRRRRRKRRRRRRRSVSKG